MLHECSYTRPFLLSSSSRSPLKLHKNLLLGVRGTTGKWRRNEVQKSAKNRHTYKLGSSSHAAKQTQRHSHDVVVSCQRSFEIWTSQHLYTHTIASTCRTEMLKKRNSTDNRHLAEFQNSILFVHKPYGVTLNPITFSQPKTLRRLVVGIKRGWTLLMPWAPWRKDRIK